LDQEIFVHREVDLLVTRKDPVVIGGITFDNVTRREAVRYIESFIEQGGHRMVCTPNADHIVRARIDEEFRQIIENADLVVSDGMAVVYASHLIGTPLKGNVGGRLLLPLLAEQSARKGYRIFLLGGSSDEVAARAAERLVKNHPGVNIAGFYSPPFMDEFTAQEDSRMLGEISRSRPDVLFVCLGTPKQEKWIARNICRIDAAVSIGIGVALDMLSGTIRQPPKWMTVVGLEWLHRTFQEPRRLMKRYFINGSIFLCLVLKQKLGYR
jgi:N-acetylglucosaminyldiphosphoundecaprenol N-acetyl-beta-D-mannosaminyltransferase